MRVSMLHDVGPPGVLTPAELPRPAPGPGQVLVRHEAIGVNFRDTWIRAGAVPAPPGSSRPLVPGNEVGGTVADLGGGVPETLRGARVVTTIGGSGGYAEFSLARAQDLVLVPDGADMSEATALLVQGRVALGAFRAARVGPSDRVLILGVAGGVGTLLAQLAHHAGATTVIGANRTRERSALAGELGATHAVAYGDGDLSAQLRDSAPEGVDIVFDGIGGPASQTAFDHLATGTGRAVVYGFSSGTPLSVDAAALVPRGIGILGFGGQAALPGTQAELVTKMLAYLSEGVLRPVIGQAFPLAEAHLAHEAMESRRTIGKTLLEP